jgi:thiol-disulfide isomerase/thioredoxin
MVNPMGTRFRVLAACVATVLGTVSLTACTGGKDAVDQNGKGTYGYTQATPKGTVIEAGKRKLAGPVQGTLLPGGSYQLSADKGKVVVLNFFASWCGPCANESPQFESVYQARKAAGVTFVGLDVKDNKGAATAFVQDKALSFPIVYDEIGKTALQIGNVPLSGLPDTVVVDKQGRVAAVYVGPVLPKELNPVLDQLTKEA